MSFYLAIVSPQDTPLFELHFPSFKSNSLSSTTSTISSSSLTSTSGSTSTAGGAGTGSFPSWSTFTSTNGGDVGLSTDSKLGNTSVGNLGLLTGPSRSLGGMGGGPVAGERHMLQMIAHASLDAIEEVREGTGSLYLRAVDRHNEWTVSAFIATNVKFILLHDTKNDDGIRLFFGDLWELYVKVSLNPFHTVNTPIRNPIFESKVRSSAKRYL